MTRREKMEHRYSAAWHRESYDRFLEHGLPELLGSRMPLRGYEVEEAGDCTVSIRMTVGRENGEASVRYEGIPRPDEEGVFAINGKSVVVVPLASDEYLDTAEVSCVGEQLRAFIDERLGDSPSELKWDEAMVRTWAPLDRWIMEFMHRAQVLDETNWLSRTTHLRRLLIEDPKKVVTEGQFGRTCPFELPEGPNIARVRSVASGAVIRDGKLVVVDDSPAGSLGVTALMVPFPEHNDANRLLMGVNMMRQWEAPREREGALVQTGYEPDDESFWSGMNFLTAFVSWGADTYEDGIVISESAAKRFRFEHPIEPGDKISNRHGTKGVISRILPDEEMPHLPDGTAVELVFSFIGCHTRLNFGQIREAVMGLIAKAEGKAALAPPYGAPTSEELRERLEKAGLEASGMVRLRDGKDGSELEMMSTAGWVYWGRTYNTVHGKIHASSSVEGRLNTQGELEYIAMRDSGAYENILETFNTRCALRDDAAGLAERVSSGAVAQASPPAPKLVELARRLNAGGVGMEFDGEKVSFAPAAPKGNVLKLAFAVPHPWMRGKEVREVGILDESLAGAALIDANAKALRFAGQKAPENLKASAKKQLEERVAEYFDDVLRPEDVYFTAGGHAWLSIDQEEKRKAHHVLFSGRSVIAPDGGLGFDQLGLPEEIAWELFGPITARKVGKDEVKKRSAKAAKALDELMAKSWLLLNRAPTIMQTAITAFHPVRIAGSVIRISPLICLAMNADFDGDQAAVFLPVTEAGQKEAGEKLSVAGHLRRDPGTLRLFSPMHEIVCGLSRLSMSESGRERISKALGMQVKMDGECLTRNAVIGMMKEVMAREGVARTLGIVEELLRIGLDATKRSGASMSPFIGEGFKGPERPEGCDAEEWEMYGEELREAILSSSDYGNESYGPQLHAVKSGARGGVASLARLLGALGTLRDDDGTSYTVGSSFVDGLPQDEMKGHVVVAREALWHLLADMEGSIRAGYGVGQAARSSGYGVIARAMRSKHPGMVFARAAENGEVDELTDVDSRLFVGLLPRRI